MPLLYSGVTSRRPSAGLVFCRRRWRSFLACLDRKALTGLGSLTISIRKSQSDPKNIAVQVFRKNHAFVDTYFSAAYSFASS
jgi:hypothetical protein